MDNFSALLGKKLAGSGGGSGTSNYNELENKPQINGNTLSGNKTAANLGLQPAINQNNKLDADLLDDSESEKKLVSENDISNWNNKYDSDDAYTKAQTDTAIETAIAALDVTETGGSGKYISAISEENGKIAAIAETMDTVPTSGSTKAVTSGGVQAPLAEVIDNGAKNLFNMAGAQTFDVTGYGIHCTVDKSTGDITLDGVNQDKKCTGNFNIKIADSTALGLQSGVVYKLSCNGYTTSDTTIGIYVYTSGATPETQFDTYDHTELAWNTAWEQSNGFRLFIRSGTVVNNLKLRPMLCTKAAWDVSHAYEPYALPNPTLTPAAIKAVDEGSKNLYPSFDTRSSSGGTGVTYSYSSGTVTAVGTKQTSSNFTDIYENKLLSDIGLAAGDKIVVSNDSSDLWVTIIFSDGTTTDSAIITKNETKEITIPEGRTRLYLRAQVNATLTGTINLTSHPMICTAADWAVSQKFVPYCPTLYALYQMVLDLQSGTRSLSLSAPSENLSKGDNDITVEVEPETMKSEVEKTEQEAEPEIEEKEGAEER